MSRVFELVSVGEETKAGLTPHHPFVRFFHDPSNLENAVLLDDNLFWGSLYLLQEAQDRSIGTIAHRIAERKIYPMLDIWKIADEIAASDERVQELAAVERVSLLHALCDSVMAELAVDNSVWIEGCYYDAYDRPIYKPLKMAGGDPQQINVQVGGKIVDIASISPVVASAASFNIHRVYYDDAVEGHGKILEEAVRAAISRQLSKDGCSHG